MKLPNNIMGIQWARRTIFNVLENALLPLSDSSKLDSVRGPNLIVNYVCLILMAFIKNGLIECLVDVGMRSDLDLAPRARTLLQRIQFLSAKYLPPKLCSRICSIERVMNDAAMFASTSPNTNDKMKLKLNNSNLGSNINLLNESIKIQQQFKNQKRKQKFKTNLEITVQRNFANMMISELTEDASLDMGDDEKYNTITNQNMLGVTPGNDDDSDDEEDKKNKHISAENVCHRLGPEFDLNSTFIRYRYMLDRDIPSSMIFQDRIPYHNHRNADYFGNEDGSNNFNQFSFKSQKSNILESLKFDQNASYSENQIIDLLRSTQVIQTKDFMKWNMDYVWKVLNGPLWNQTNLMVAINRTRFIKRLVQYLKPSKQFFCLLKWNISTIRHAQCACQLFRILISCDDGCKNEHFTQLIEEIFACLKDQIESNLQKRRPNKTYQPFTRSSIKYTLSRTYIILIGILSESHRGMKFFKQHNMFPFLFPLTTKEISDNQLKKDRIVGPNDYLLRLIATNLGIFCDYFCTMFFRLGFMFFLYIFHHI